MYIYKNIPCLILKEDSPYFQILYKDELIIINILYKEKRIISNIKWNQIQKYKHVIDDKLNKNFYSWYDIALKNLLNKNVYK